VESNSLVITGTITESGELRSTPGGVPFRSFLLEHRSRQLEADYPREAFCRIKVNVRGEALQSAVSNWDVGSRVKVQGFLARPGVKDETGSRLVLHAQEVLF